MSREAIGNYLHAKEYDDAIDFILTSIRNKISLVSNDIRLGNTRDSSFMRPLL